MGLHICPEDGIDSSLAAFAFFLEPLRYIAVDLKGNGLLAESIVVYYITYYEPPMVQGGRMSSITLHNLDRDLEQKIREKAQTDHTSLNQTIKKILREALNLDKPSIKKADFSDLAGTMTENEAREFEEATQGFSKIDRELWV